MPKLMFYGVYGYESREVVKQALLTRLDVEFAKEVIILFHNRSTIDMCWLVPDDHAGESTEHVRIETSVETSFVDSIALADACVGLMDVELVLPNGVMVFFPKGSSVPGVSLRLREGGEERCIIVSGQGYQGDSLAWQIGRAIVSHVPVNVCARGNIYDYPRGSYIPRVMPL